MGVASFSLKHERLNMDRETIETEIANLRRARGFALLHGKKFDDSIITALQQKLDSVADVEAEQTRLEREAAAQKHQAEIVAAKTEIADLTSASAKALAEARAGYAQGAAAMKLHLQTEASLRKLQAKLNQLTGEKTSILIEPELHRKRSLQIAAVGLKPITGHLGRFGNLTYPSTLAEWK